MDDFELFGELPRGTTVLEASAGTGKTFTIAALVTRYVAEGIARLDELLVVTFGRAATQELRDRVRERLVSARDGLADPRAASASDDELLRRLADVSDDEIVKRRHRLVTALAAFDEATVVTIHQFCQQMLIGLGTAGDLDNGAELVENLDDLVTEVVDDLYLRKWGQPGATVPTMTREAARDLAAAVVADAQAVLVPDVAAGDESDAAVRVRFAHAVRREVERRKRERRIISFDDLLTRLQDTLADRVTGPAAATRLRSRYRIVLVDEFQDTDPVQWEVLRLAFHGAATLVLIGDPKQAIYAFRGADVQAYLNAAELADQQATLAQNWRSDAALLRGLDALFRGAALGDPRIVVGPVSAAHPGRALDSTEAPVRLRLMPRDAAGPTVGSVRERVTRDVVAEIVQLLDTAPTLTPRDRSSQPRPVRPGDLAVIVRTGTQATMVHTALLGAGVPSVLRTTSSVFATQAAAEWIVLLEALEQPHRRTRLRRLAVSSLVGWDAAALEDADVDAFGLRLRHWVRVHAERGIAALFETVSRDERLTARLLGQLDGERLLTDLRHVGEAVHAAATAEQLGLTASLEWLRNRVADAGRDLSVERSRRLDSDAAAVQVVTVHASKGLEFPVVYVPFGWDRYVGRADVPRFHEDDTGRRVRNVGGAGSPGFDADQRRHNAEEFGEDLRLLYVSLTRAQAQVTLWWAASNNTEHAPLHRLLFSDTPSDGVPDGVPQPSDAAALRRASALAVDGCLAVTATVDPGTPSWRRPASGRTDLVAARFARTVDLVWRRTSYSALTAAAHDSAPVISSEPEVAEKDDEPTTPAPIAAASELADIVSPMAALPGGAAFGTLVHAVLESLDPHAGELDAVLREQVRLQLARSGPADLDADEVSSALLPALRTPLAALDDRALADLPTADQLAELEFELPLRGGDTPNGRSQLREVAPLLRKHLPPDDPLARYADLLDDPVLGDAALIGYLTGSIDAVVRSGERYVVIDYKTNRLGDPDTALTAWDYRPAAMADAMLQAHYPLQALLYEVALHRFLRWRLADYDPRRHLGGALYLFLRGMCGPDVRFADGAVPGVFDWRPPAELVVAVSDLLAGGYVMADLVAQRAVGLLRAFTDDGVLSVADVHVATRLGALAGERDELVLLAVALVVRGTRQGSVVLDLADVPSTVTAESEPDGGEPVALTWPDPAGWLAACARSPLVESRPTGQPVHLVGSRLWLDRYWQQEAAVAADITRRCADRLDDIDEGALAAALAELFADDDADQRAAVELAARSRVSVVAGGPGTGKTTTIARLIAVLVRQRPDVRIALAAPTGKAAARLGEAVHDAAGPLTDADRTVLAALSAATLHRLLGRRPGATSRFRHDRDNRLPYDVVIVDESSMVSLTLMARLLDALPPHARLVLVGDPDQLASVEAGAVLGDLVDTPSLAGSIATLTRVHRYESGGVIARLAQCVRDGRDDDAVALLDSAQAEVLFHRSADDEPLTGPALDAVRNQAQVEQVMIEHARSGAADAALEALDRHRLLCAHRLGPRGVRQWSTSIERWLLADDPSLVPRLDGHYAGQPLMITANDYENELFNGDTGVVVAQGDDLFAAFRRGTRTDLIPLVRLAAVSPVHAMTVHRAQGSQFDEVTVLLPFAASQLATRQTFYTAITRARSRVHLIGSEAAVRACITRTAARATGLRDRLSGRL